MTTGSFVADRTQTVTAYAWGCFNTTPSRYDVDGIGFKYSRTWSGSNSVITVPSKVWTEFTYDSPFKVKGYTFWRTKTRRYKYFQTRERQLTENPYSAFGSRERNTLVYSEIKQSCLDGFGRTIHPGTWQNSRDYIASGPHVEWGANDDIKLAGKLREKIQGEAFNAAVFLGEGRESLAMITDAARRILSAGKSLKKGRFSDAARILTQGRKSSLTREHRDYLSKGGSHNVSAAKATSEWFAQNWLQLQYGWKPLLEDVKSAAAHLAFMQNRPVVKTYRVGRLLKGVPRSTFGSSWVQSGESRVYGGLIAHITHINDAKLAGLTDPASLVWELIPYSFVADWFVPVGDYLSALALNRSLTGTYVKTVGFKVYCTGTTPPSSYSRELAFDGSPRVESWSISRNIVSGLSFGLPSFKGLDKTASLVHCISAVSLLINTFPRLGAR